jgi:hypothetical protein
VKPAAVLCWSTGMKKGLSGERKGPLTSVETRGIEPLTSCLQIADGDGPSHSSHGAAVPRPPKFSDRAQPKD